jgi:uncharacterized RDD family membrane protein YckC
MAQLFHPRREAQVTVEASRSALASDFLEGRAKKRRSIAITTPEGVTLFFDLADVGERATAFAIDFFLWTVATIFFYLILFFVVLGSFKLTGQIGLTVALSIMLFLGFAVRNLYFIHFELAWQGSTPGKRAVGIRVVDRKGGPLTPMAIVARNLTREIEIFIPLGVLSSLGHSNGSLENLALAIWMLLFSALPLFNRLHMRGGDLIAGTVVVALPRKLLLTDLVDAQTHYVFLEKQLRAYGTFELQILEELLRRPNAPDATQLRREVCDKIVKKIDWPSKIPDADTGRFLTDFYAAQRAHLEREQLYGKFRADKNAAAIGR